MTKRILIECTPSFSTNMTTGIQRVVRSLVFESLEIKKYDGYEVIPVILYDKKLYKLPRSLTDSLVKPKKKLASKQANQFINSKLYLKVKYFFREYLYFIFGFIKRSVHNFLIRKRLNLKKQDLEPIMFNSQDILILPDVNWGREVKSLIDHAKQKSVVVCMVFYDLIPLDFPNFCGQQSVSVFESFINTTLLNCDAVLSISKSVQNDLIRYCNDHKFAVHSKLDFFYLGADKTNPEPCTLSENRVTSVFEKDAPVFLIVSTIEPRKNHDYLIDAFEKLWKRGAKSKLLVVGKVGWMVEKLMKRLNSHVELNKRLFIIHDASDEELMYFYKNSTALIFPSFAEGFGLPIIESLQNGLPVIASDIPVHREIAQDNVMYVNPKKPSELVEIIKQIEANGIDARYVPSNFVWMNWREATQQFLQKVITVCQ